MLMVAGARRAARVNAVTAVFLQNASMSAEQVQGFIETGRADCEQGGGSRGGRIRIPYSPQIMKALLAGGKMQVR